MLVILQGLKKFGIWQCRIQIAVTRYLQSADLMMEEKVMPCHAVPAAFLGMKI
jgi:hypothetical protein